MPIFDSAKGDIPYNQVPSSFAANFGGTIGGIASMRSDGTLFALASAGLSPAATGTDIVISAYTLPANAFDIAGRGLFLSMNGTFGANSNAKRVKIFVGCTSAVVGSAVSGGTAIADTGALTTTTAIGLAMGAAVYKTGTGAQIGIHQSAQWGTTVLSLLAPQALSMTESAPIIMCVTGTSNPVTDIVLNLFTIEAYN